MVYIPEDWIWIVVVGFVVSFLLAFGIGANDVANSFGTSVGSGVLTIFKACVLGCIFEVLGAVLIGYKVSDTIRKGIVDVEAYNNSEELLLLGNLSALGGSCIWMFIATFLSLPVSATHSIVGATVGFSLVAQGTSGIDWLQLGYIFLSWLVSPLMSGIVSTGLFILIRHVVLNKEKPLEPGLKLLPVFYAATIFINAISIFLDGSELLQFDKIPLYGTFIIAVGLAVIAGLIVGFFVVPRMRDTITNKLMEAEDEESQTNGKTDAKFTKTSSGAPNLELSISVDANGDASNGSAKQENNNDNDGTEENVPAVDLTETADSNTALLGATPSQVDKTDPEYGTVASKTSSTSEKQEETRDAISDGITAATLFSFLQILTAVFGSFAHGGNDVSNAIGPLVGLWEIATTQEVTQEAPTPIWILVYGGVGISVGLCILGWRVIKTMGEDLSKITPSSGFCIELGAAFTVLVASNIGIPVSTTHCKVGSIVFVGRVRSNDNVDWSLFRNIIFAWVATLPAAGATSALIMYILKECAL